MDPSSLWPLAAALALAVPLTLGLTALVVGPRAPLRAARRATAIGLGLALAAIATAATAATVTGVARGPASLGVRLDLVTAVMLLLVATLGLVIARYSERYLDGDPGQARYARWLLATLAAVTVLVLANNLLALAIAWIATSLALHQLLTFYPDRPRAVIAAHKKFLVSRLADACLLAALALLAATIGSLDLDAVDAWLAHRGALPPSLHVAAALLVVAAALKSAQLPFHGWLTQVMEAPTPVSALLHAGIVNIGGFLMLRVAPLLAAVPAARLALIVIGLTTTLVAALVMTTRVSIKVALAWSTCAQMGFLLVECGLGAWPLALLHLVAHSLYKAHAFLDAGGAVARWRISALALPTLPRVGRGLVAAAALTAGVLLVGGGVREVALAVMLGLALAPLGGVRLLFVVVVAVASHVAVGEVLPAAAPSWTTTLGWAVVMIGFAALYLVQAVMQARPTGAVTRALQPRLFAGLYLDERFTRLSFRIWPPRPAAATARPLVASLEVAR